MSSYVRVLVSMLALFGTVACRARDSARVDSAALAHTDIGPELRITILGNSNDPRIPPTREAIAHWNGELARLGLRVHLDSGIVDNASVPEEALRTASGAQAKPWSVFADARLRAALSDVPGDIVIALSHTDMISFGVPWRNGRRDVVGIRRADRLPLSLPNTLRNVVAHELGHVLGLTHNADSTTLMCGRPASCRPASFASDSSHFFPLTARDEQWLRQRWP